MEEPFKPLSLSIGELFGNKDSLYKIPQYQRPYKWQDDEVDKLWDDIYEAYMNSESNYFLGSIITAKPRDNENSAYVDVVDGQQRMTTLMILFCVIRDLIPNINEEKAVENPFAVDIDTIKSSISLFGKSNRLKLFTHSQHQTDFDNLIINGNTTSHKKPYKYQIRTDEEPKYKFINTAIILRDKLESLGSEESSEFVNYLFNKVKIIRIDCKNRSFAIKLFQVLNDRGMDLTASDLIKSFLLEKLYKIHNEDQDTSKKREEQFITDWRATEEIIKNSDLSMNDLFILYEYYLLAQNPKKSLYDELQDAFRNLNPNEVIGDIKKFANLYYSHLFESDSNAVINSMWYLRWSMYWKTILVTALHVNYDEFDELTKSLRRFYYLYWIGGKTLSQIKQTSFNVIKWVKDKEPIDKIKSELHTKLANDGIVSLAKINLLSKNIRTAPWIKPLLILIEYNQTDESKMSYIELSSNLHLEHILPIKYTAFEEWNHITSEVADRWLNSAGNFTLISGKKNIEASNNPFIDKLNIYKGKGRYKDKDQKITAFIITQGIVHEYEPLPDDLKIWDEASLIKRWHWFIDEITQILNTDLKSLKEITPSEV